MNRSPLDLLYIRTKLDNLIAQNHRLEIVSVHYTIDIVRWYPMLLLVLCDSKQWTTKNNPSDVEYNGFDNHEEAVLEGKRWLQVR